MYVYDDQTILDLINDMKYTRTKRIIVSARMRAHMRVARYAYDLRNTNLSVFAFLLFLVISDANRMSTHTHRRMCALTPKMNVKFAVACSACNSCDSKIHATEQSTASGHHQNRAITKQVICPRRCWLLNCLTTIRTLKYHCHRTAPRESCIECNWFVSHPSYET